MIEQNKYLDLLYKQYGNEENIISEIINLKAIQNLPKGTEHFVSDLHGEFNAFQHLLRNGSGNVKEKINDVFNNELTFNEKQNLASLIYYPEEKLKHLEKQINANWYRQTIDQLIRLIKFSASKYTRSKLRKSLPKRFSYIIEELLYQVKTNADKAEYYNQIISNILTLKQGNALIIDLCYTIQRLVIDHLHVVGDIYDRGPAPDKIIDALMNYHSVDIQWGNHDIIWIGAAAGSPICMMNIIRISARYNNLDIIEDTYGINLRPLLTYAEKYYLDNPVFQPKTTPETISSKEELLETTKIHQAAAILQFKLEEQLVSRRQEFNMDHRKFLTTVDYTDLSVHLKGKKYTLTNTCFMTVDPNNPTKLTLEEEDIIERLMHNFIHSEKLKRHTDFLVRKGNMYLVYNDNLLIHGCVPLNQDGSLKAFHINGHAYKGKYLLDFFETSLRRAYANPHSHNDIDTDLLWYLWSGENSSLFGKKEMTTFERYFIKDKETHIEEKNAYYKLREDQETISFILSEFGLNKKDSHLINGHTPVKEIKGETPIKAGGKMLVIDGGFSKPYQKTTGIAGYTLLYNSYGMQLVAHKPFSSIEEVILQNDDIASVKRIVDRPVDRKYVRDTTIGASLQEQINDLNKLLNYLNY